MRVKRGLTQETLSELVNISQRTLSGIEIGETHLYVFDPQPSHLLYYPHSNPFY